MFQLILTIISIALFSAFTAASMNYIPVTAKIRETVQVDGLTYIESLEGAVTRYFDATRDVDGNLVYPGNGVNMVPLIAPDYGFMPPQLVDLGWEVRTAQYNGLDAVGICLRPVGTSISGPSQEALEGIQAKLPAASTFVSTACNATSDTVGGTYLTHWVVLQHML